MKNFILTFLLLYNILHGGGIKGIKPVLIDLLWLLITGILLVLVFANGIGITWGYIFIQILFAYCASLVLAVGKIDIAFTELAKIFGILTVFIFMFLELNAPAVAHSSVIFQELIPLVFLVGGVFLIIASSKSERLRKHFYYIVWGIILLTALVVTVIAGRKLESVFIPLIVLISLFLSAVVYYLIIFMNFNPLIYSVIVYLMLHFAIVALQGYIETRNSYESDYISITPDAFSVMFDNSLFTNPQEVLLTAGFIAFVFFISRMNRLGMSEKLGFLSTIIEEFNNIPFIKYPLERIDRVIMFLEAVGSNQNTAKSFGVEPEKYIYIAYNLMLFLSFFAGYLYTVFMGDSIGSETFQGWNLEAIFLAVVAGTNMNGGRMYPQRIPLVVLSVQLLSQLLNSTALIKGASADFWIYTILGAIFVVINIFSKLFSVKDLREILK